ncbi:hypothetical protein [Actinacidiphila sp. ITFR-21]|uniref:hypothetical protein n=1 Tax=Actinacidiphila sp. ITFR-21 TaxID=3075199 RepID=UPI002889A74B|nr:hypothetical protein [Streptomyces sp. ITFR-21]WNI16893.1 hypothetical protein RLT57_16115 [Streptomyces sp. ITFR-21]
MPDTDQPQVCGRRSFLPAALVPAAVALEPHPGRASAADVERDLRCTLQAHGDDDHQAFVLDLDGPDTGAVWASWCDGTVPAQVRVLPPCPAVGGGEPCMEYAGHRGGHSFELHDPLADRSRAIGGAYGT